MDNMLKQSHSHLMGLVSFIPSKRYTVYNSCMSRLYIRQSFMSVSDVVRPIIFSSKIALFSEA